MSLPVLSTPLVNIDPYLMTIRALAFYLSGCLTRADESSAVYRPWFECVTTRGKKSICNSDVVFTASLLCNFHVLRMYSII